MATISKINGKNLADLKIRKIVYQLLTDIQEDKDEINGTIDDKVDKAKLEIKEILKGYYNTADIDDKVNRLNDFITKVNNNTYNMIDIDNKIQGITENYTRLINQRYSNKDIDKLLSDLSDNISNIHNNSVDDIRDTMESMKNDIANIPNNDNITQKINNVKLEVNNNLKDNYYTNLQMDAKFKELEKNIGNSAGSGSSSITLTATLVDDDTNEIVDDNYDITIEGD